MTTTLDRRTTEAQQPAPLDPKRFRALAVIAVAQLMVVLDASVVIIALPSAQRSLHISTANRQWMLTAYTLSFAGLLLLGGRIADYLGRKRMFIISLIGFAAASALGGLAENSAMLFGARALQGAFAAIMAPAALSLLTVAFTEPKERARAFGVYGGIAGGGAAIGLILGGALTQYASWRWTLLINVPIAIVAAIAAVALRHREPEPDPPRLRHPRRDHRDRGPPRPRLRLHQGRPGRLDLDAHVSLLRARPPCCSRSFVLIEQRVAHPLLPLRIVLDRNRGGSFLASLLVGTAMLGHLPVPDLLLPGDAALLGHEERPGLRAVLDRRHHRGRRRPAGLLPRFGPRFVILLGLILGADRARDLHPPRGAHAPTPASCSRPSSS